MTEQKTINSYLSFKLGQEVFASNVDKVLNILELTNITKVPKAPFYMKGVINLRGHVLPVIDTKLKFGMEETVFTENTCIIVMCLKINNEKIFAGMLADNVQAVIDINEDEIKPPPSIGSNYKSEFITGIANVNEEFIMILDLERIFSSDELIALKDEVKEEITTN